MGDLYGREAVTDHEPRCWRCNRKLAHYMTRPWSVQCSRCKAANHAGSGTKEPVAP